jgi:SAM-dependent methyltransferase
MSLNPERVKFIKSFWSNLSVPVRPGVEGLALYRAQMERFPEKNILVLGATPELVDLALELNAKKKVSVERNPEVMEAMRQLGKKDWTEVELVAGNWFEERPDFYSSFNCVVCDGGLLFLEYPGQWERLFKLIYSYLVPGGVFVAKEWAEPPGNRDYDRFKENLIGCFEAKNKDQNHNAMIESYIRLVSELWLATLIKTTRKDGSFDQDIVVKRLDTLTEELKQTFPEPKMVQITEGTLQHLARSQPGTTDVITGVRFEAAEALLAAQGFRSEHFPLPDPPIFGANYMFVADKTSPVSSYQVAFKSR